MYIAAKATCHIICCLVPQASDLSWTCFVPVFLSLKTGSPEKLCTNYDKTMGTILSPVEEASCLDNDTSHEVERLWISQTKIIEQVLQNVQDEVASLLRRKSTGICGNLAPKCGSAPVSRRCWITGSICQEASLNAQDAVFVRTEFVWCQVLCAAVVKGFRILRPGSRMVVHRQVGTR